MSCILENYVNSLLYILFYQGIPGPPGAQGPAGIPGPPAVCKPNITDIIYIYIYGLITQILPSEIFDPKGPPPELTGIKVMGR